MTTQTTNNVAFNTTLVGLNPDYGFLRIDGESHEYTGYDLSDATFIQCHTPEEVAYVTALEPKVLNFLQAEVEAFPFNVKLTEAKDMMF